jgi:hypothetical protein
MRGFLIVLALVTATSTGPASAQYNRLGGLGGLGGLGSNPNSHYVSPHITSQGNYVGGHYRTNPNSSILDNYGTRGNINPYTGAIGTRRAW